jgi:hypothetical protein
VTFFDGSSVGKRNMIEKMVQMEEPGQFERVQTTLAGEMKHRTIESLDYCGASIAFS